MLILAGVALLAGLAAGPGLAQDLANFDKPQESVRTRQQVAYVAEAQVVPANKRAVLELRFHVADGYHVNSHTPKSELLIATVLAVEAGAGVKAEGAEYPAGKAYRIGAGEMAETLDVYTGDFVVKLPVLASAGAHTAVGTLRYQACDKAACYPSKVLKVEIPFTAK